MDKEFYFPLKREQLVEKPSDDRFYIEERIFIDSEEDPKEEIESLIKDILGDLNDEVLSIYSQKTFSSLYTIISAYQSAPMETKIQIVDCVCKPLKKFSKQIENYLDDTYDNQAIKNSVWRNCLKIFIFFTEWTVEQVLFGLKSKQKEIKKGRRKMKGIGAGNAGEKKTKKKATNKLPYDSDDNKEDFSSKIGSIITSIVSISNSNIKTLFRNKIIEDDIINLLIKICFDSLEISVETKNLQNKEIIFTTLQQIITKFQSNTNIQLVLLKLTTKIVNLIYSQEQLVSPLTEFIVLAIKGDSSLSKMAVDIIHEVSKTVFEDTNMDSQGLKNVGRFLVILSEKTPKTLYNNITSLIQLFDSESYVIRNSLVELISNIIINILCNLDDISDVDTRNNYLKTKENFIEILFDRIYDKNGFCRAKVLSIFEKLVENNTISVPTYLKLLTETSGRLKDEKSNVRKRAISLIGKIISMYAVIFKSDRFLSHHEIDEMITASQKKLNEIEEKIKNFNSEETSEEKTKLLEESNKETAVIEYFENYRTVLKAIDQVVPCISQLLGSKNITDVQESIDLFIVLQKFRITSSIYGVKKMLTLIMKPEPSIKKKVIDANRELYFTSNKPNDVQAAYLVSLAASLNFSELACLRELLKALIQDNLIDLQIFKDIWKIMLKNPENEMHKITAETTEELNEKVKQIELESLSALQIINIASDYEPSLLLNNADLYIKNVISNLTKKKINWMMIKNSLPGLQKIYPLKKDITELCLLKISKTILSGYGKEDNNWFVVTKEMIDTIFQVVENPEKFTQYFIIKLSRPFFINNENKNDENTNSKFMTQNILTQQNMEIDGIPMTQNGQSGVTGGVIETITPLKVAQLIFVIGHVALNMVIYSEKLEINLKKKAEGNKSAKKKDLNKSKDDINEIAGGKEAEIDFNVDLLHKLIDEQILNKNLISKFTPMIIRIAKESLMCSNSELKRNLLLYKSAILALCKLMCINQKFCEENLEFMFDILASDTIDDSLKLNVCCAFGDFINRFPNITSFTSNKFFGCLHSKSPEVRRYAMIVISHLVLGDMLKLKGEVVDIAMLLETDDDKLKELVNLFFHEINNKGNNAIYNIIPKALAKLTNEYKDLSYQKFQNIVKTLINYVEKDKHTEGLVDKLFSKLKNSTDSIEWRNNTYCLSLLNYQNEKIVTKFIEMYSELKDKKDEDQDTKENLANVFYKFKRINNLSQSTRALIDEVEKKVLAGEKFVFNRGEGGKKRGKRKIGEAGRIDDEEDNVSSKMDVDEERGKKKVSKKNKKVKPSKRKGKKKRKEESSDEEESDSNIYEEDDDDELEEENI